MVPWLQVINSALPLVFCSPPSLSMSPRTSTTLDNTASQLPSNSPGPSSWLVVCWCSQILPATLLREVNSRKLHVLSRDFVDNPKILHTSRVNLPRLLPTKSTSVASFQLPPSSLPGQLASLVVSDPPTPTFDEQFSVHPFKWCNNGKFQTAKFRESH